MSNSTRRPGLFGRSGTVTVLDAKVTRASARNAIVAFFVTAFTVGLLSATILADRMHPVLALLLGIVYGLVAGVAMWLLVTIWPVLRLLWWWLPELCLGFTVVYGWIGLARHTNLWLRLLVVALLVGVPAGVPFIRRRLIALAWCVIVRHRLRTCFNQFIIANRSGSLPFIFLARPTLVGERVWIYLRPGLSVSDLTSRLEKVAVACHASTVIIERASDSNSAFLRVDVKRRNALKATIGSPLVDLVDPNTPTVERAVHDVPTALDLPDVPATPTPAAKVPAARETTNGRKPADTSPTAADGDDIHDWI